MVEAEVEGGECSLRGPGSRMVNLLCLAAVAPVAADTASTVPPVGVHRVQLLLMWAKPPGL